MVARCGCCFPISMGVLEGSLAQGLQTRIQDIELRIMGQNRMGCVKLKQLTQGAIFAVYWYYTVAVGYLVLVLLILLVMVCCWWVIKNCYVAVIACFCHCYCGCCYKRLFQTQLLQIRVMIAGLCYCYYCSCYVKFGDCYRVCDGLSNYNSYCSDLGVTVWLSTMDLMLITSLLHVCSSIGGCFGCYGLVIMLETVLAISYNIHHLTLIFKLHV